MKVSVFGNSEVKEDSLVVNLVAELKKRFPEVEFKIEDPSEGLRPSDKGWWVILDVAKGIKEIKVFKDLDKLVIDQRVSLHDYDVGMELKLLKKVGKAKKIRVIAVPMGMKKKAALKGIISQLEKIISS
jgi:hypothetical protein